MSKCTVVVDKTKGSVLGVFDKDVLAQIWCNHNFNDWDISALINHCSWKESGEEVDVWLYHADFYEELNDEMIDEFKERLHK